MGKYSLTWEEGRFDKSNEESDGDHAGEVGNISREGRDHAPKQHYTADVDRWSGNTVDDHVLKS